MEDEQSATDVASERGEDHPKPDIGGDEKEADDQGRRPREGEPEADLAGLPSRRLEEEVASPHGPHIPRLQQIPDSDRSDSE